MLHCVSRRTLFLRDDFSCGFASASFIILRFCLTGLFVILSFLFTSYCCALQRIPLLNNFSVHTDKRMFDVECVLKAYLSMLLQMSALCPRVNTTPVQNKTHLENVNISIYVTSNN